MTMHPMGLMLRVLFRSMVMIVHLKVKFKNKIYSRILARLACSVVQLRTGHQHLAQMERK